MFQNGRYKIIANKRFVTNNGRGSYYSATTWKELRVNNYDNSPSGTESVRTYITKRSIVFMFSRQTDCYLPSREATSSLFSVYVLIG